MPHNYSLSENDDDFVKKVVVSDESGISLRKFVSFLGPGFIVSIAYLDPGNIESDLRSGTIAGYKLLWLLLISTIFGALLQRLSLRLGVVTGKNLAQTCRVYLKKVPNIITWIMVEIAIVGSDMQEVIGTSIAFYILSKQHIPLYGGVLITVVDTFLFLLIDRYGFRKLEAFFAFSVFIMGGMFGYLYIVSVPDQNQVLRGIFIPGCSNCNHKAFIQAVGIVGAVIMPHNIYLHSALVESRKIDRSKDSKITEANFYFFLESCLILLLSFIINLFVVSTFASAFSLTTGNGPSIYQMCLSRNISNAYIFKNMTSTEDMNIFTGSIFLGCKFGIATTYIWAIGIMAAGQTSTMTGTYTGQFVMQGFLDIKWKPWKRIFITRSIAIGPTILISVFQGLDKLTMFNDFLNVLMSIQLPFALIPVVAFTSSSTIMGEQFVNKRISKVIYTVLISLVLAINIYLIIDILNQRISGYIGYQIAIVFLMFLYLCFVIYMIICFLVISEAIYIGRFTTYFTKLTKIVKSTLEERSILIE